MLHRSIGSCVNICCTVPGCTLGILTGRSRVVTLAIRKLALVETRCRHDPVITGFGLYMSSILTWTSDKRSLFSSCQIQAEEITPAPDKTKIKKDAITRSSEALKLVMVTCSEIIEMTWPEMTHVCSPRHAAAFSHNTISGPTSGRLIFGDLSTIDHTGQTAPIIR